MTEEEMNGFISDFLKPRMNRFAAILADAGVEHRLTLSDGLSMGVSFWPAWSPVEVFATFLQAIDGEEEECAMLRLSTEVDGKGDVARWTVFADDVYDVQKIDVLVRLLLSGIPLRPYPDADDMGADLDGEGGSAPDLTCMPRLNTLFSYLEEEEATQSGVIMAQTPFIQMLEEGFCLTLSYRPTDDDDVYLFNVRADVPIEDEMTEEEVLKLCEAFNERNSFVKAYANMRPIEVYGAEPFEEPTICLVSCVPEFGGMPDAERYFLILSLFIEAADGLLRM